MRSRSLGISVVLVLGAGWAACERGSLQTRRDAAAAPPLTRDGGPGIEVAASSPADAAADAIPLLAADAAGDAVPGSPEDASGDAASPPTTIVVVSPEPWGPNCPRGGVRIVTALDLDGNHTIDSADQTLSEQFVCNVYPVSVSVGRQHSCALASNRTVWCWGADDVGQLGDYAEAAAYAPRPVSGVETALALAAGGDFACVILPTTGVRCWGRSDRGQGGHGLFAPFISPSCVTMSSDGTSMLGATSLALGRTHACAALDDGTVNCWGANENGQLGDGSTLDRNQPVPVAGITGARSVAAGVRHTCALLEDSTVRCWGANDEGQLGDGSTTARSTPVAVKSAAWTAPLAGVTALAAGDAFTCALLADATLFCWGGNAECQLGLPGTTPRALLPVAAPVRDVQSVAAGAEHACAVLGSGKAVCWGRNDFGQAGAPAGPCRSDPVEIPLAQVLSVGAGGSHSCAVDEVGIWCWGDDARGQLGIGIASPTRSTHEPQPAIWHLLP
jgi:alpha-tubulin suppressor-like RCC1 family protein